MKRFTILFLLMLMTVGCTLNPVNPLGLILNVGIFWVNGEGHKYYKCDQSTLLDATRETVEELGMYIEKEESQKSYYYILARAEKKTFKIKIRRMTNRVSRLSIRVNTFGDKPYAELFFEAVDNKRGINEFRTVNELETTLKRDGLRFRRIRE